MWCTTSNNPEGIQFPELEYVVDIQRYLEVDMDDPTQIVNRYINAWWWDNGKEPDFALYTFDPHDYLVDHRPQVHNMFHVFYLLSQMWID